MRSTDCHTSEADWFAMTDALCQQEPYLKATLLNNQISYKPEPTLPACMSLFGTIRGKKEAFDYENLTGY